MRKILNFQCNRSAAEPNVPRITRVFAFAVTVAVTLGLGSALHAQSTAQNPLSYQPWTVATVPTASPMQSGPVQTAGAQSDIGSAAVSADYSLLNDDSQVELAGFGRTGHHLSGHYPSNRNACNPGCDVSIYGQYESLWLKRDGDKYFSLSRNSFLPEFDYEWGGRYTVGQLFDCVNGWEAVYVGPYDWNRTSVVTGPGNIQSNLRAFNGYGPGDIDTFYNADLQSQQWRAQLHSLELSRRWSVWDVVSTMVGARYIDYEEDFVFFSSGSTGAGLHQERVDNQMAGLQIGADMLYPTTLRSNIGFKGKAGVYANFDERNTYLINNGNLLINAGDSRVDIAGMFEFGVLGNYHILPSVRLTAGYEFWWMPGMATIPEQGPTLITPATGTYSFHKDDLFLHGGSVGLQVLF